MTATEYQLSLIDWQFFGTATWRSSMLGTIKSREKQLWNFLKDFTCFRTLSKFNDIPIVIRWERGEIGERPHAHYLLAGILPPFVNITSCFKAMHYWHESYGLGRVRLFGAMSKAMQTRRYVLMNERNRADVYELGKFDHADRLVINDAAWRRMLDATATAYVSQLRTV